MNFAQDLPEISSLVSKLQYPSIGPDNGLAPTKQ